MISPARPRHSLGSHEDESGICASRPGQQQQPPRVRRDGPPVVLVGLLLLIGAGLRGRPLSHRSPTIDILGSYFPAWMICIVSGLTLTLVAHWIVQLCHLKPYLGPAPLVYSCSDDHLHVCDVDPFLPKLTKMNQAGKSIQTRSREWSGRSCRTGASSFARLRH